MFSDKQEKVFISIIVFPHQDAKFTQVFLLLDTTKTIILTLVADTYQIELTLIYQFRLSI